jgi:hypothetical protein
MRKFLLVIGLTCSYALQATASGPGVGEVWQRDAAMEAINSTHIDVAVSTIGNISTLADAETTLDRLNDLENRADWPLPVREAALYRFTRSLADLPRDAVAVEVIEHLHNYQARTLVPHEEHRDYHVPLFNIRAATTGVANSWTRAESRAQAMQLLDDPAVFVDLYLQYSTAPQRYGHIDALQMAPFTDVRAVQDAALEQLAGQKDLSPLIAKTASITADREAMEALLVNGSGAGLARAFRQFDALLGNDELVSLLEFAVFETPPENASLAMAAWWPRLKHDPATRDLVIGLLGDAGLGSSAVLALSKEPDIQTIKLLQDIAASGSSDAQLAQQALDLNRARLTGGDRP